MTAPARAVAVAAALGLAALGISGCTGNDNGGVITPPPPGITTTTVATPTTPSTAVPSTGGTLPNS